MNQNSAADLRAAVLQRAAEQQIGNKDVYPYDETAFCFEGRSHLIVLAGNSRLDVFNEEGVKVRCVSVEGSDAKQGLAPSADAVQADPAPDPGQVAEPGPPRDLRTAALDCVRDKHLGCVPINPDDHAYFHWGSSRYMVRMIRPCRYVVYSDAGVQLRSIDTRVQEDVQEPRGSAPQARPVHVGCLVKTLAGELDLDESGLERATPPGSIGYIAGCDATGHWDLVFPTVGSWVKLTARELRDRDHYQVMSPCEMAAALDEVRSIDAALDNREVAPTGSDYNDVLSALVLVG